MRRTRTRPLYRTPAFVIMLALATLGFLYVMRPFYGAIFWAATLSILFWPMHRSILAKMPKSPSLAALLSLLACLLLAIIPIILLSISLIGEIAQLYIRLRDNGPESFNAYIQQVLAIIPDSVRTWIESKQGLQLIAELRDRATSIATETAQFLLTRLVVIGQNTLMLSVNFVLVLYLLFFFFRDGDRILRLMRDAIPMRNHLLEKLGDTFANVVNATIKGNFIVAAVQGGLGGLLFWSLGIPSALVWGVVMGMLSLLPAVGTWLVWGPVAIYLLATGAVTKGIIMIAVGLGVISMVDNVLRPVLVGRQTKMPDYIVLLSTFGGLSLFGISGFVIGPVIAAMFLAVWSLFVIDEKRQGNSKNRAQDKEQAAAMAMTLAATAAATEATTKAAAEVAAETASQAIAEANANAEAHADAAHHRRDNS